MECKTFRSRHNTTSAIADFVWEVLEALSYRVLVSSEISDLSRVFYCVSHEIFVKQNDLTMYMSQQILQLPNNKLDQTYNLLFIYFLADG